MPSKMIYVTDFLSTLLKFEDNASGLICGLLRDYYAGNEPIKAKKVHLSKLKSEQKLVKLSIKLGKKEQEKQADLVKLKEKFDNVLTEAQIKAWEKKWA